jgi:hypothetical protein
MELRKEVFFPFKYPYNEKYNPQGPLNLKMGRNKNKKTEI